MYRQYNATRHFRARLRCSLYDLGQFLPRCGSIGDFQMTPLGGNRPGEPKAAREPPRSVSMGASALDLPARCPRSTPSCKNVTYFHRAPYPAPATTPRCAFPFSCFVTSFFFFFFSHYLPRPPLSSGVSRSFMVRLPSRKTRCT